MPEKRRYPRTRVAGLSITMDELVHDDHDLRVVDVSEHGLLVEGIDLPSGHGIDFILEGGGFECSGHGRIARCTNGISGIAIDGWSGPADDILAYGMSQPADEICAELSMMVGHT